MENKPTAGSEVTVQAVQLTPAEQPSLVPAWLRHTGRLVLSTLAIAAGGSLGLDASAAYGDHLEKSQPVAAQPPAKGAKLNYVKNVQPVKAHVSSTGHDAVKWVEFDNAPYGDYLGQFNNYDQVTVLATTKEEDYDYLAISMRHQGGQPFWACGWALTGALVEKPGAQPAKPSPCVNRIGWLARFEDIGTDPNCAPGDCDDGTFSLDISPECNDEEDRNDALLDAATAGVPLPPRSPLRKQPLFDSLGTISNTTPAQLHYRYRPIYDSAATIRSDRLGWGDVAGGCVTYNPTGGPANTQNPLLDQETAGLAG